MPSLQGIYCMDKKFIITVAISILIALGFVGCGAKQKDTTSSEPAQTLGVTTVTSSEVENTVPKGNPTETTHPQIKDGMDMIEEAIREALKK